jgi:starch-binding outer membrane protein, SusD/RagB family
MKKITIIYLSILILLGSCADDVLDKKPLDKISDADVWSSAAIVESYVAALYQNYPFSAFNVNWPRYSDESTENARNENAITRGTMSRTSDPIGYWDYAYIRKINVLLERIGDAGIGDILKARVEGEARVLRAAAYYEMMIRYGGVPIVDVVLDPFSAIDQEYTRRSTEEALADFIDAELTKAIALLPENPKPTGRINKWTAYAFKARANLWAASIAKFGTVQINGLVGIPEARANDFYTKASAAAKAVIESGRYSLYNKHADKAENYRNIFLEASHSEVIWERMYDGVNIGHSWDTENAPPVFSAGLGGRLNPVLEFLLGYENIDGSTEQPEFGPDHLFDFGYEPFQNKDPRLRGTVFFQGDNFGSVAQGIQTYDGLDPSATPNPASIMRGILLSYNGVPTVGDASNTAIPRRGTQSGFLIKKYVEPIPLIPRGENRTNWITLRLAEMYLVRAEAEYELGNLAPAAEALNATRDRAGISLVDETTITRDHVRTERRSELAFENHRFWDLRRWRIAESVLNHRFQGLYPILHYETRKFYYYQIDTEDATRTFHPEHYYNPITDSRIQNNSDLIENPGY